MLKKEVGITYGYFVEELWAGLSSAMRTGVDYLSDPLRSRYFAISYQHSLGLLTVSKYCQFLYGCYRLYNGRANKTFH